MNSNGPMGSITIVGSGMHGARHLTLEAIDTVRAAHRVYHLVTGMEAVQTLTSLNPRIENLFGFYQDGMLDLDVYGRMVSFLLAQAMAPARIAFVVMGHPAIYVAATFLLREHGPRHGVQVRVLPGVSAIDVMLTGFEHDIGNTGLQILDANRLVAYSLVPQRNVPLLVFQVGCFGSGIITRTQRNDSERLEPLARYLMRHYPETHGVELIECEMGWPHREVRHRMTVAALAHKGHLVTYNTTLWVPPSEPLQVTDEAFQQSLVDPQAVGKLVA